MLEIKGKYNSAKVFTDKLEESAASQIETLCNQEFVQGSKIRVMPDVHAGAGCTIGTTMTITDKVVPNLVGVDIGCGMETIAISNKRLELQKLDKLIYATIPSGFEVRQKPHHYNEQIDLTKLRCSKAVKLDRAQKSIGTLGGGNHFIEVNRDEEGNLFIVVHSGSRHLGLQVAKYYQEAGYRELKADIPFPLAYVTGSLLDDYLHDMKIVQRYAELNRKAMMTEIIKGMKLDVVDQFTTTHNYLDTAAMILRKGAVSAQAGERLLIPLNMRDGSLICVGKGNPDWNYSAPHGAGRLMSRAKAKQSFTVSEFKKLMKDVYTTSVNKETLDECPMAYKDMAEIVKHIEPTAEIVKVIKPIYNFKAGEGD
jgi:tRNA-splicing ligase RtcB